MNSDETRKKIQELRDQIELECVANELDSLKDNRYRSRNLTVGTCFGGVVNVAMVNEHHHMYAQLQPTEAIEIIEQLAAGVGVEIAMRPKKNFASWRGWEEVIDQRIAISDLTWKGAAAHQLQQAHETRDPKTLGKNVDAGILAAEKEHLDKYGLHNLKDQDPVEAEKRVADIRSQDSLKTALDSLEEKIQRFVKNDDNGEDLNPEDLEEFFEDKVDSKEEEN